jgi:hypothetical protein
MAPSSTSTLPRRAVAARTPSGWRPAALHSLARSRRSGGPQDRALYRCACGYAFEADVTASVQCPRCDTQQAW